MSARIHEIRDTLERQLNDKSKPWTPYFDKAEQKTGVSRVYLFVGKGTFSVHVYFYP